MSNFHHATITCAVLLALGTGAAHATDVIGATNDNAEYSFYSRTNELRDSNLSNSKEHGQVVFVNGSATLNVTGGNTIVSGATGIFANTNSTVNISGKNTIKAASHAIYANTNSKVTIVGENAFEGSGDHVLFSNSSSSISVDGNNVIRLTGDSYSGSALFTNGKSVMTFKGTNRVESTGGAFYSNAESSIVLVGDTTINVDDSAFYQNGQNTKLTFVKGSTTTIEKASVGIYSAGQNAIEEGASVEIKQSEIGVQIYNKNTSIKVSGLLDVTSSGAGILTNSQGSVKESIAIDGGSLRVTSTGTTSAIKSYQSNDVTVIAVRNSGTLEVDGTVDAYNGGFDLENSTATFSDLTLKGDLKAADSTFNSGKFTNKGSMNLTDTAVTITGTENGVSSMGKVTSDSSTFTLGKGKYTFTELNGNGNKISLNEVEPDKVVISSSTDNSLTVTGTANADDFASPQDYANALAQSVTSGDGSGKTVANVIETPAGSVFGETSSKVEDGVVVFNPEQYKPSEALSAYADVIVLSAMTLRHEMNSLSKRMGELRDSPAGVGAWIRAYGSEMEYGHLGMTAKNNSLQVGSDYTIGDWKVGAAFTYTDGENSYNHGSADNKGYGLALYGTWFVPCGAYVDLMAKYNRLDNDFDLNGMKGAYSNDAFGVSAETGYRFNFLNDGVFVEPQIGLSYTRIKGDSFHTADGVAIDQDDYDSFLGRVGFRTGFKFPNNKGTFYARVSGVHEFEGESSATASKKAASITLNEELKGTWLEMGIGANFNWTDSTYTYIDLERTTGGDVKENYRWNIGVRHAF